MSSYSQQDRLSFRKGRKHIGVLCWMQKDALINSERGVIALRDIIPVLSKATVNKLLPVQTSFLLER
jgi:hypothetical protein